MFDTSDFRQSSTTERARNISNIWIWLVVSSYSKAPACAHRERLRDAETNTNLFTYHFSLGAEVGMTLQGLVVLALDDVGKHFVVHLVCRAI